MVELGGHIVVLQDYNHFDVLLLFAAIMNFDQDIRALRAASLSLAAPVLHRRPNDSESVVADVLYLASEYNSSI